MTGRRVASIGSALVVAGIAAIASYSHMRHLALEYGQTEAIADMLPVSVDGMLVVATVALGDGRRYRWSAWLAFWIGVVASIVANVLAAQPHAIARCISAWPAIAFLLVVEVITRGGRGRTPEPVVDEPPVAAEEAADDEPELAVEVADVGTQIQAQPKLTPAALKIARVRRRYPELTQQEVAGKAGLHINTVKSWWAQTTPPEPEPAPAAEPINGNVPQLEGVPS